VITLADKLMSVQVEIHYVVYDKEDVIGKYLVIHNSGETSLAIRKAMSLTLCLVNHSDTLVSTYGTWAGELNLSEETIHPGKKVLESLSDPPRAVTILSSWSRKSTARRWLASAMASISSIRAIMRNPWRWMPFPIFAFNLELPLLDLIIP
jgi:hypothetical protein